MVVDARARGNFDSAIAALIESNYAMARKQLEYATDEWPEQCDFYRALELNQRRNSGGHTGHGVLTTIRNTLNTFDDMVSTSSGVGAEFGFFVWELPMIPIILPPARERDGQSSAPQTRGQIRAGYAAGLVEQGRYDEAREELDMARREKVVVPENATDNERVIAAVECLLYYRTSRWEELISTSTPLTMQSKESQNDELFSALGNAFGGAALAHLGSHAAGQTKLINAIESNPASAISAWAALQLGLSYRTADDEEAAQRAFAAGLQYGSLPELLDATRNKNTKMRVTAPDVIAARTSFWDPNSEPDIRDFQRQSSQDDRREVLKLAMEELDNLEGMEVIKEQMRTFAAEITIEAEQRRRGMTVNPKNRHLVFNGPPGTGKTTIATLVARLYYGLGVIPTDTLVTSNRATLIGAVEGESAKKTMAKITEARGGVLFVDEAYELLQDRGGHADPFGSEALTTLMEMMELWRDELVLIVAGYEDRMDRFLSENPGLKSRFSYTMTFTTYTPEEVWGIFTGMARQEGRLVDPAVEERFKEIVEVMWVTDPRGSRILDIAGNGRFARNVFEQAQGLASRRILTADLSTLTDEQLLQLSGEDILGAMSKILKSFGITNIAAL